MPLPCDFRHHKAECNGLYTVFVLGWKRYPRIVSQTMVLMSGCGIDVHAEQVYSSFTRRGGASHRAAVAAPLATPAS